MPLLTQVKTLEYSIASEPCSDRPVLLRYLVVLFAVVLVMYPLPFFLVLTPSYENWATSQWGPILESAFDHRYENADVVIFGDSSAFLGIDPRLVNTQLKLKSIVLPGTVGSIPVIGDRPLQQYLVHNRPPRLLVFYFSAWNLDFDHAAKGRLFEGEEIMFRHMSRRDIASFAVHHPTELLEFPFRVYSTFGPKMITAYLHHVNREKSTVLALGHVDYTEPYPPLKASCIIPSEYLARTGSASVQDLVRRYTTPQTAVMVYLAPIPGCRNSQYAQQRPLTPLVAAPPAVLPAASFAADPYYAHIRPSSVPASSALLSAAVANRLQQISIDNAKVSVLDSFPLN